MESKAIKGIYKIGKTVFVLTLGPRPFCGYKFMWISSRNSLHMSLQPCFLTLSGCGAQLSPTINVILNWLMDYYWQVCSLWKCLQIWRDFVSRFGWCDLIDWNVFGKINILFFFTKHHPCHCGMCVTQLAPSHWLFSRKCLACSVWSPYLNQMLPLKIASEIWYVFIKAQCVKNLQR